MGLFQRNDQFNISQNYFTVGLNKSFLIIGLGNPESKYDGTRHNIGFACLDAFLSSHSGDEFSNWQNKTNLKCLFSSGTVGDTKVLLVKPTTYMNLSGESVKSVADYYKIPLNQMIVVHDELDIKFGQIKTSVGGSSAGHNGIESIISSIGPDFVRLRIGVGLKHPEQIDSADFVLAKFSAEENKKMDDLKKEVVTCLNEAVFSPQIQADTRSFLI